MSEYFTNSFIKITREQVLLFGGAGALVLQVSHPAVATAVYHHSNFQNDALGRLFRTLQAIYGIAFGSSTERKRIAENVFAKHQKVQGTGYSSFDPETQCWVLATLTHTAISLFERWISPLSLTEKDQYLLGMNHFGSYFGQGGNLLAKNWEDFQAYWINMIEGETLASDSICHQIARAVLFPKTPFWLRAAWPITVALAAEVVPQSLWQRLNLPKSRCQKRVWRLLDSFVVPLMLRLPPAIRFVKEYNKNKAACESESNPLAGKQSAKRLR